MMPWDRFLLLFTQQPNFWIFNQQNEGFPQLSNKHAACDQWESPGWTGFFMTFADRPRMQQNQLFHSGSDWSYPAVLEVWLHLKLLFPHLCWSVPENHWPSLFFSSTIQLMEFELERCRSTLFWLVWDYSAMLKKTTQKQKTSNSLYPSSIAACCQTVPDCPWPAWVSCHISLSAQRNGVWLRLFLPWILRGLY